MIAPTPEELQPDRPHIISLISVAIAVGFSSIFLSMFFAIRADRIGESTVISESCGPVNAVFQSVSNDAPGGTWWYATVGNDTHTIAGGTDGAGMAGSLMLAQNRTQPVCVGLNRNSQIVSVRIVSVSAVVAQTGDGKSAASRKD